MKSIEVIRIPNMDLCSVNFILPIGHSHDSYEKSGLAHLVEHMIFHSHPSYSQEKLYMKLEEYGGIFNAKVSVDYTVIYGRINKKHVNIVINLFAETLSSFSFDSVIIEQEKKIVNFEMKQNQEVGIERMLSETFHHQFKGHAYERVNFNEHSFETITLEDVQTEMRNNYSFEKWSLLLVGNIEQESIEDRKYTGRIDLKNNKNQSSNIIGKKYYERNEICNGVVFSLELPEKISEMDVRIMFNAFVRGLSSPMYSKVIKEQGLTYGIHTHFTQLKYYKGLEIAWQTSSENVGLSAEVLEGLILSLIEGDYLDTTIFKKSIERTITELFLIKENFGLYSNELVKRMVFSQPMPNMYEDIRYLESMSMNSFKEKLMHLENPGYLIASYKMQ